MFLIFLFYYGVRWWRERVLGTTGVCVHEYFFWIMVPAVFSFVYAKCYDYVMWTDF